MMLLSFPRRPAAPAAHAPRCRNVEMAPSASRAAAAGLSCPPPLGESLFGRSRDSLTLRGSLASEADPPPLPSRPGRTNPGLRAGRDKTRWACPRTSLSTPPARTSSVPSAATSSTTPPAGRVFFPTRMSRRPDPELAGPHARRRRRRFVLTLCPTPSPWGAVPPRGVFEIP